MRALLAAGASAGNLMNGVLSPRAAAAATASGRAGRHPVLVAAEAGHAEALEVLLGGAGCPPDGPPNADGFVPLHLCSRLHRGGAAATVLVAHGADINVRAADGRFACDLRLFSAVRGVWSLGLGLGVFFGGLGGGLSQRTYFV